MNELKRSNQLRELEALQHGQAGFLGRSPRHSPEDQENQMTVPEWVPMVDISEDEQEYLIKAELPEVKEEGVKVTAVEGTLTIMGERRFKREENGKKYHRLERAYGSFVRNFALPDDVTPAKVSSEFKDGILIVHLAKTEKAKLQQALPANNRNLVVRSVSERQLKIGGGSILSVSLPSEVKSSPSPPTPDSVQGKFMLNLTMEHNTEHAFLTLLIAHDTSKEGCRLQDRMIQSERDKQSVRRAVFLMVMLVLLSLVGLSCCAILLPDFFFNPGHLIVRGLCSLGLGSLISLVTFIGYLLWHHAVKSRVHEECRLRILALAQLHFKASAATSHASDTPEASPGRANLETKRTHD